jgi:hypothetical protein
VHRKPLNLSSLLLFLLRNESRTGAKETTKPKLRRQLQNGMRRQRGQYFDNNR